jgi:hypothetical protein
VRTIRGGFESGEDLAAKFVREAFAPCARRANPAPDAPGDARRIVASSEPHDIDEHSFRLGEPRVVGTLGRSHGKMVPPHSDGENGV